MADEQGQGAGIYEERSSPRQDESSQLPFQWLTPIADD